MRERVLLTPAQSPKRKTKAKATRERERDEYPHASKSTCPPSLQKNLKIPFSSHSPRLQPCRCCCNVSISMSLPDINAYHTSPCQSPSQSSSPPPPPPPRQKSKVEESDENLFTVPDMESRPTDSATAPAEIQQRNGSTSAGKHRRGRNPADREYKRLKRLLRNRVSAQQARERKKVYVNDLESKARELHDKNSKLEEKISTLINENTMLRKVLMNTRPKADESIEPQNDQSDRFESKAAF